MSPSASQTPVVAVLNMKGGVGKTTIAAAVFREMHKATKRRILLVDFDPQYNLTQLLLTSDAYEELVDQKRTLFHVLNPPTPANIFQISDNDLITPDKASTYITPLKYVVKEKKRVPIDLLAGDFRTAAINLLTEPSSLRMRARRFEAFIQDARAEYDLVVVDCNPSSSFMTRTAVEVSTRLLVPVRLDRYSKLGLDMIVDFMENLPTLPGPREISIVVNELATYGPDPSVLNELRSNTFYGPRTLANTVPNSKRLEAQIYGAGFPNDRGGPYSTIVNAKLRRVADEFATIIGF